MTVLLGRQSAGTTADFFGAGHTAAWPFVAVASGSLKTIWAQRKVTNSGTGNRLGIYADSGGSPGALLGVASVTFGNENGTGVFAAQLATPVSIVSGTTYWLAQYAATDQADFQGTSGGSYKETNAAADFPNPFGAASTSSVDAIIWGEDVDLPTFPSVRSSAATNGSTAAGSHDVTLPATIEAGDTLVILGRVTGAGAVSLPAGWVVDQNSADGSDDVTFLAYRNTAAAGSEDGTTVTVSHGASQKMAALALAIRDAADPAVTPPAMTIPNTGASTTPNPGSLSPSGGLAAYLWLWAGGWEGEQTSPPSGTPTGYAGAIGADTGTAGTVATNARVAIAVRQNYTATEDPPAWTISSSDDWTTWAVCISPAVTGPTSHQGAASLVSTFGIVTASKRTRMAASSLASSFGIATVGRRGQLGVVVLPSVFGIAAAGRRGTSGAVVLPSVFGIASAGVRQRLGALSLPSLFLVDVAGDVTTSGSGAVSLETVILLDVAGETTAKGAASLSSSFGIATDGTVHPRHYGASSLSSLFGIAVAGRRGRVGASSLSTLFGIAVAGRRGTLGAVVLPSVFGIATASRATRRGAVSLPIGFTFNVQSLSLEASPIVAVLVDGVAIPLADVFAGIKIVHGRGSLDEGPLASSATLEFVNVDRAFAAAFTVGAELELQRAAGVARFVGRITDAALDVDAAAIACVAIGGLARLLPRPVGAEAWPEEAWSDRVSRAFTEAGAAALLVLEVGPYDPLVAARDADATTFGDVLEELLETVPAAVADTPAGLVLVQTTEAREGSPLLELDPALVAYSVPFKMSDDVTNDLTVTYAGGELRLEDLGSLARFDRRNDSIATTLVDAGEADERLRLELRRRAWPAWAVEELELLELDPALGVGSRVLVAELPAVAPKDRHLGILEGWTDEITGAGGSFDWTMTLNLSPARLSGAGVSWAEVDPTLTWATVDPAQNWIETEELLA